MTQRSTTPGMRGKNQPPRCAPMALALAAALAATLAIGCTSGASSSPGGSAAPTATPVPTGPISYATGSADLVVRAWHGGGLLRQEMRLAEIPDVSVYGSGRAITVRAAGSGSADALLPRLEEASVSPEGMATILNAARDAGLLGPDRRYDLPDTYDLWTVVFTVVANSQTHQVSAFGLGFSGESRIAPPGEVEARKKLQSFFDQLLNLPGWLGAGSVGNESPYVPAGTRIFVIPLRQESGGVTPAPVTPNPGQEVRGWPLDSPPELFGASIGPHYSDWRCAVLDTDGLAALGLATATSGTRWQVGEQLYEIVARPLLPDEAGCPTDQ